MSIRPATLDDLPRIIELGELLHNESPRWSRLSFSRVRAGDFIARLILADWGAVFLAERSGVVVGGIAGTALPHWSSDDILAQEASLFMLPEARGSMAAARLVSTLDAWARMRGAVWMHAGTSTGLDPERTSGLYETLGFARCAIGLEKYYGN